MILIDCNLLSFLIALALHDQRNSRRPAMQTQKMVNLLIKFYTLFITKEISKYFLHLICINKI